MGCLKGQLVAFQGQLTIYLWPGGIQMETDFPVYCLLND